MVAVEGDAKRLDRFELVAELAAGGMATVYLARLGGAGGFQRFVAIKRLHPHLARENEFIEMFLDEARLAARIHHPNVVPILEIGQSDEGYYLVMEYIEGDTLGRLLARSAQTQQKIPQPIGVRIVLDALAGLHAAHELKDDEGKPLELVHRDVSPQNILVGVDGSSRITDFGVARAASRLSTTRTGQLKGKLAYMAPEQVKEARTVDRRADVFAMGTCLWEVLACKRLFKGDGEADTMNRVLNEPIPQLRAVVPGISAVLDTVVMKALDRDRAKRYSNAAEFADALERAARVVSTLAAHREVAAYVDAVIGTEISQQREVVRAWLARSEPSRHGIDRMDGPTKRDSGAHTKVEGRGRDGSQPSSVSSVSSAAVAIPPEHASGAALPVASIQGPSTVRSASDAPGRKRSKVWAAAVVFVLVGGGGFALTRWQSGGPRVAAQTSASAPTPPAPPPATAETPAAAASANPTPSAAATTTDAPALSASASSASSAPPAPSARPKPPTQVAPARPVAKPETPPTSAPADDMSRNPYR